MNPPLIPRYYLHLDSRSSLALYKVGERLDLYAPGIQVPNVYVHRNLITVYPFGSHYISKLDELHEDLYDLVY